MEIRDRVLGLLQKNARLSHNEIAERLDIAVDEVEQIVKDSEANKTIYGYYTLINEDSLGRQPVRALIEVGVQPERDGGFDHVARLLSKFSEVTDVVLVSGSFDLQLVIVGETLQDVASFVASKLAPMDGVRSTRTHFMLKKYKEAGFQVEEDEDYERLSVAP
jgi:DNA-binding Lrp family transcriptional regulator